MAIKWFRQLPECCRVWAKLLYSEPWTSMARDSTHFYSLLLSHRIGLVKTATATRMCGCLLSIRFDVAAIGMLTLYPDSLILLWYGYGLAGGEFIPSRVVVKGGMRNAMSPGHSFAFDPQAPG